MLAEAAPGLQLKSVLVLSKETRLQAAARQLGLGDLAEAETALRQSQVDVTSMQAEHKAHTQSVEQVVGALQGRGVACRVVPILEIQDKDFTGQDLILSVGGDGSFVSCTCHVHDQPILGINSNPPAVKGQRIWSVGYYTRTTAADFPRRLQALMEGRGYRVTPFTRMEVRLNGGSTPVLAFAEVYVGHPLRKKNSRHLLEVDGVHEEQYKTSGLIVYPAHAYTAWAGDEGADPPADPASIYYFVTGVQRRPELKLRGGPIHGRLVATSSLTDGVVSVDTYTEYPFLFGHTVEITRSSHDLRMIEFPT
ncbi:MAG TPA: hypothetical protein VGO93_12920 [Candidatus Xenobia bacterium]|jgi:hypothetical protein